MDLYINNLENYIKRKENGIKMNEIKEVLIKLNNIFKK